jgi:lysine 2,3-aminomutase
VTDVILSGGDPLVMSTRRLTAIVARVRAIPSVETIRLATRVPSILPQRVDDELVAALRPYHPIWVMAHFNHPRELGDAARGACQRWVDGGFPVMNQTVLLRGVNDDAGVLAALFRGLVRERVRPYYLLQMDPVQGTGHLRTPLEVGRRLLAALQGQLSGIALPRFIVDTPGGHGKVPYAPDFVVSVAEGVTRFRAPDGALVDYLDPR